MLCTDRVMKEGNEIHVRLFIIIDAYSIIIKVIIYVYFKINLDNVKELFLHSCIREKRCSVKLVAWDCHELFFSGTKHLSDGSLAYSGPELQKVMGFRRF